MPETTETHHTPLGRPPRVSRALPMERPSRRSSEAAGQVHVSLPWLVGSFPPHLDLPALAALVRFTIRRRSPRPTGVVTLIAWWTILFTGNYPEQMFGFAVGVIRFQWRVGTSCTFMLEPYPSFSLVSTSADPGDDPATFSLPHPQNLGRGLIFIKVSLLIPVVFVLFILGIGAHVALVIGVLFGSFHRSVSGGYEEVNHRRGPSGVPRERLLLPAHRRPPRIFYSVAAALLGLSWPPCRCRSNMPMVRAIPFEKARLSCGIEACRVGPWKPRRLALALALALARSP
jgi:hypothetical protein